MNEIEHGNNMDIDIENFVYHSPTHFLDTVQYIVENVINMENNNTADNNMNKLILINQCNFIVMCAAGIESHLNWYYFFDKNIDVDKNEDGKYMSISDKIKKAPLTSDTKGGSRAIFNLRDQVMHAKYKPRNAKVQFMYNTSIMLLSFKTLVNVSRELLTECPNTLTGRIALHESQEKLADYANTIKLQDENGKKINWVEAVKKNIVSLPIPSVFHVPQMS